VPDPTEEPVPGLTVRRTLGPWGTRFSAVAGGEEVGFCEIAPELTRGGLLPALRGWAELQELWVLEGWRDRGIGGHLVRHAVAWLRLAGCDRIVFNVASSAQAAGAGRFHRRFGWEVIVREVGSNTTVSAGPGSEKS
jgi:GNAT superfamily N-acetyltransferase